MIVIGADMHKRSHTIVAVGCETGELLGENALLEVGSKGFRGHASLGSWSGR